eukprot:scaffold6429_cov77-Skeletonema_dohrnii-CCMP3373.AAC.5
MLLSENEISIQMISLVEQKVITALMACMMVSLNINLDVYGIVDDGMFIIDEVSINERINSDVPMLLTRMAEEISCRAQASSNSTAENDDLYDDVLWTMMSLLLFEYVCGVGVVDGWDKCLVKEVEVLKKLKLAICCSVQIRSVKTFFHQLSRSSQVNHADRQPTEASRGALAAIDFQSWCQKVVGGHLPLLEELIIFPEGKFTHHQLANNHVAQSKIICISSPYGSSS